LFLLIIRCNNQSIESGIHGNKGTEAAIAIKMAFIRQQASLTSKESKFIANWSLRIDKGLPLELKNKTINIIIRPILFS
jgi:hypothetical protein